MINLIILINIVTKTIATIEPSIINVKQIEFEAKIDKILINNLNKNLYIATSSEILILDKNLSVLKTSLNDTNCSIDTATALNRQIYIFDINYYSPQQPTLLECSSNNGNLNCRIRNLSNLKCIHENLNDDLNELHLRKALSFSSRNSLSPPLKNNNYLINKKNFLYLMPTIKNLGDVDGDIDDLKLLYIFNLNSTQLFQFVILNDAFNMDSSFMIDKNKNVNVVYRFSFKAYVYYLYVYNKNNDKITKLLRFCDNNNNNNGNSPSSEFQLKCNLNSVDYLEALSAFFISNKLFILFKSASNTILCTIELNKINSFCMKYIHRCLQPPPQPTTSIKTDVDMCKTDFQQSSFEGCDCESIQKSSKRIMIDDETFCSSTFDGIINIKKSLYLNVVSNLRFDDVDDSAIRIHASNLNRFQVMFIITSKSNLYLHKLTTLSSGNQMLIRFLKIDLKQYFITETEAPNDVNIDYNELNSFLYLSLNRKLIKIDLSTIQNV